MMKIKRVGVLWEGDSVVVGWNCPEPQICMEVELRCKRKMQPRKSTMAPQISCSRSRSSRRAMVKGTASTKNLCWIIIVELIGFPAQTDMASSRYFQKIEDGYDFATDNLLALDHSSLLAVILILLPSFSSV